MTKTSNSKFADFLYNQGDRISLLKRILAALNHPDQKFKIIHICGTNGKGSTAIMIANLLKGLGLTAGLFTSPAIGDITDTIRVNLTPITMDEYQQKIAELNQLLATKEFQGQQLSQFEADFLVSMMIFAEAKVGYVVLECGLGGELDATNAVTTTMYSIFTKVSLDHLGVLGNTLAEIATTKAKIIRPNNTTIVAANQRAIARKIIRNEARAKQSTLLDSEQFSDLVSDDQFEFLNHSFKFGLTSGYEQENLATVLCWLADFQQQTAISDQAVTKAITDSLGKQLSIPGRFEQVRNDPVVILDAAHNPDGITAFVKTVVRNYHNQPKIIINGFLKDKDYETAVSALIKLKHAKFIITNPENEERELNSKQLDEVYYEKTGIKYPQFADPITAVDYAIKQTDNQNPKPVIFVVGSFYLINPVRSYLIGE